MKFLVAGGTGAIGRPLVAELLARGHSVVALTRSPEKARVLVDQGIKPAIADVFDAEAVKAVVRRTRPEVVIEQLTALPKAYTRESMSDAAAFNTRLRLEGGGHVFLAGTVEVFRADDLTLGGGQRRDALIQFFGDP